MIMLPFNKNQQKFIKLGISHKDKQSKKSQSFRKEDINMQSGGNDQAAILTRREYSIKESGDKSFKTDRKRIGSELVSGKCASQMEYSNKDDRINNKNDQDRHTQLNKRCTSKKNKNIQEQLEQQQLVRQGIIKEKSNQGANQITSQTKIKISSKFRKQQPIPKLIQSKQKNKMSAFKKQEQQQKQRLSQEHIYSQIINEIQLNNLHSKVIQGGPATVKQNTFLHKITQSQSAVINTPSPAKKMQYKIIQSPGINISNHSNTYPVVIPVQHVVVYGQNARKEDSPQRSLFDITSQEELIINRSVQRLTDINDITKHQLKTSNQMQIHIKDAMSSKQHSEADKNQQKNNFIRSKVIVQTKINQNIIKSKNNNCPRKLNIFSGVVNNKIFEQSIQPGQDQKRKLNQQLIELRKTVRELRLQKIKAKVQKMQFQDSFNSGSHTISYSQQKNNSRYQSAQSFFHDEFNILPQQSNDKKNTIKGYSYGKIKRNKSINRKKQCFSKVYEELTQEKSQNLQVPIINPAKLRPGNFSTIPSQSLSSNKNSTIEFYQHQSLSKQFKTMDLQNIMQQNMEESIRFNPVGTSVNQNQNNMRGKEICSKVLNKFDSSNKKFKTFIKRESSKSKIKANNYKTKNEEKINKINNPLISKQPTELAALDDFMFEGTIVKNTVNNQLNLLNANKSHLQMQNSSFNYVSNNLMNLIQDGQSIKLQKKSICFSSTQIPSIPDPPTSNTSTDELMDLIIKILPLSQLQYNEEDLSGCTLKKYKNCIMFESSHNKDFKIVWHYTGKIYIGEWNTQKHQKDGQGLQFVKNKFYYKGSFNNGKKDGNGIMIYTKGSLYEGQFVNGEKEGYGCFLDKTEKTYFEGEWKESQKQGHGHLEYGQNIYEGMFQNNLKNGFGIESFQNGDKYIGQYKLGKFDGEGKYIWSNGSYYIGKFLQGFKHGYGKWQSATQNYELYIGQYFRDKKQGKGKYIWNNRCIYDGQFYSDLKNGLGSIQYPDGRYMEGLWAAGILTQVISKVTEAHLQAPLDEPKSRVLQTKTVIKIRDIKEDE